MGEKKKRGKSDAEQAKVKFFIHTIQKVGSCLTARPYIL
jgi:hypothetical protein